MPNKWDQLAADAASKTNKQFESEISSLTRFNDAEIKKLIHDTGISQKDLAEVLREVKSASKSNLQKANAIKNISKGVDVLVGIASKLI